MKKQKKAIRVHKKIKKPAKPKKVENKPVKVKKQARPEEKFITIYSTGDIGDEIAKLPILRQLGGGYIRLGNHYRVNEGLHRVMEGEKFNFLLPLLKTIPYVKGVTYSENREGVQHDFSDWRSHYRPNRTLTASQADYVGLKDIDMAPWISVEPSKETEGKIVIARSQRYHNLQFNWNRFLEPYEGRIIFLGFKAEYEAMCKNTSIPIGYQPVKDALEMAQLIAGSDLFIGNQSCACWLAMAMGHPLIQETYIAQPDSKVIRDNATFIELAPKKVKTEKEKPKPKLMLALQYYDGDKEEAMELALLLADIQEENPNNECEFLISHHAKSSPPDEEVVKRLSKVFTLHVYKGTRLETGHPGGCNALWHDTMHYCTLLAKKRPEFYSGVFTFEGDGVPTCLDWIKRLSEEWAESPSYALGHISGPPEHPVVHMNGNAIFQMDITSQLRLTGCAINLSWDFAHAARLSKGWRASRLIFNDYSQRNVDHGRLFGEKTREASPYNGEKIQPVWVHGVKDDSARKLVREKLLTAVVG